MDFGVNFTEDNFEEYGLEKKPYTRGRIEISIGKNFGMNRNRAFEFADKIREFVKELEKTI